MIVVKIELWPRGFEENKKEIGRMHITNKGDSSDPKRGNYFVQVMRRGTTRTAQKTGEVLNYPRQSYSVWKLVMKALKDVYE